MSVHVCARMCAFACQCVSSLSVSVILCVNRAETAQVDIVLSCMGKRVACCVCGLRQAWGKPSSTGDIIGRKTTRLGITPPTLSPLTLHQPAVHELISALPPHSFFSILLTSLPLTASHLSSALHLCSLIQHHLLFSTLQTNYPTNSLSALLAQIFLDSIHFCIVTSTVYLAFIWRFLKQMVYWLCNTFMHVSVNMSEVLCTCWV